MQIVLECIEEPKRRCAMKVPVLVVAGFIAMALICSDASAMCGGGGMRGGSRSGGGVSGARVTGGGGSRSAPKSDKKMEKAALPPAVEVANLDTSSFDSVAASLNLSEEQAKKIEEAKKEIRDAGSLVAKAQKDARAAYDDSKCEASCTVATGNVVSAANACKSYEPAKKFESKMASILSHAQREKLKELTKKS
jgi:hypothetical protein